MRTLVRCIALTPVAVLIVLLVLTHVLADWLDGHGAALSDEEGELHA